MYLVNNYVVVSTNIFLSWLTRGILQLQHISSNSCGRTGIRDHPSGTCRWTSTKVDPVDSSIAQSLFSVCFLLLWEGSVCLELALAWWNVRKEFWKGLGFLPAWLCQSVWGGSARGVQGAARQWGKNKIWDLQVTFAFDVFLKLVQCPVSFWITEVAVLGAAVEEKEAPWGAELGAVSMDVWLGLWWFGLYSLFCTGDAWFWRIGTFAGSRDPRGAPGKVGPQEGCLGGAGLVHPRGSQVLMEKAQLCCSCSASECLHIRPQWVPAQSYSLGMGEFYLALLLKQHRHSLHSSLPSGENQRVELFLRCLFGTRTIWKFCIFIYLVTSPRSAAHHLPSASFRVFFCLHPSLACALEGEIPGLQTAEPAVQCHVKGKQTPAIQELKWLS